MQISSCLEWGVQRSRKTGCKKGKRELWGNKNVLYIDWSGGYSCIHLSKLIQPNMLNISICVCKLHLNKTKNEIESFICGVCGLQQQRTKQVMSRIMQPSIPCFFLPPNLVDQFFHSLYLDWGKKSSLPISLTHSNVFCKSGSFQFFASNKTERRPNQIVSYYII